MSLRTWRVLVHPRLGLLGGSRDEELEAVKCFSSCSRRVQKDEMSRVVW